MKRWLFPAAAFVVVFLFAAALASNSQDPVNGEGLIFFRNGSSVRVDFFGEMNRPDSFAIEGKHEGNNLTVRGTELSKIALVDEKGSYAKGAELLVVNRAGERFLVKNGVIVSGHTYNGWVHYVYTDPITKVRKETRADCSDIQEIVIGPTAGRIKVNPITKERFPDFFMFDPYNGTRLVWADDPSVIEIKADAPVECRALVVRKKPIGGTFVVPNVSLKLICEAKAEAAVSVNTDGTGSAVFQVKPGVYNAEFTVGTARKTQKVVVGSDGLLVIEIND